MKFWNTKFDDSKDQYTMYFRVLTKKKTTLELRQGVHKYLHNNQVWIWMQSTEINYNLNNNLGFVNNYIV